MSDVWYRIEDYRTASAMDMDGDCYGPSNAAVRVRTFNVERRTPQGVWLKESGWGERRWCLLSARKRFACPTLEEAYESFLARKLRQISILTAQIEGVKQAMAIANRRYRVPTPPEPKLKLSFYLSDKKISPELGRALWPRGG